MPEALGVGVAHPVLRRGDPKFADAAQGVQCWFTDGSVFRVLRVSCRLFSAVLVAECCPGTLLHGESQ